MNQQEEAGALEFEKFMKGNDKNAAFIQEVSQLLIQAGVNNNFFLEQTYCPQGYSTKFLAKLLRPFKNSDTAAKCERMLQIGVKTRHFDSVRGAQALEFYNFCKYLRTRAGQDAISQQAKQEKLAKRGGNLFTTQDMAWFDMFQTQQADYSNALRARKNQQIDQELRDEYQPASCYEGLSDDDEISRRCWKEYINECQRREVLAVPISDTQLAKATEKFGDIVKKRVVLDFLSVENHKQQLSSYINKRVGSCQAEYDFRAAKRFRMYLDSVQVEAVLHLQASNPSEDGRGDDQGKPGIVSQAPPLKRNRS